MADLARTLRRARRRVLFLSARQLIRSIEFERIRAWGHRVGRWQYRRGGRTRERCLHDLARLQNRNPADPVVAQQLLDSYCNYTTATLQVLAMCDRKLDAELLNRECVTDGLDRLRAALQDGRGVILLSTHSGNSLLLAAQLASAGLPMTVVYRQALMMSEAFFAAGLPRYGIEGVLANDGAKAYAKMRRAIKNNRVVFVMIDQGVKGAKDGIPSRFLGKDMPMPPGPAQLARVTGAPIFPLTTVAAEPVWRFVVEPAVQLQAGATLEQDLQQLLQVNEQQVLAHPEFWSWAHRRWRKFPLASA